MKIVLLLTKEEAKEAGVATTDSAHRNDIDIDDGRGGYRSTYRHETFGKVIVVIDSKEWGKAGKGAYPGIQCYCDAIVDIDSPSPPERPPAQTKEG